MERLPAGYFSLFATCISLLDGGRDVRRVGLGTNGWIDGMTAWMRGCGPCICFSCCCSKVAAVCALLSFQRNPVFACTCKSRRTDHCYHFYSVCMCVWSVCVSYALCFVICRFLFWFCTLYSVPMNSLYRTICTSRALRAAQCTAAWAPGGCREKERKKSGP